MNLDIILKSEKVKEVIRAFLEAKIAELDNEDEAESWDEVLARRTTKKKLKEIFRIFGVRDIPKPSKTDYQ